jgi:iron complex transport system substrate-binding protein
MSSGKIYIVGVGPGSSDWVSQKARRIIRNADIIVGWEMDIKPVAGDIKGKSVFLQEGHNYLEIPAQAARVAALTGATVAVLKTGDPLIAPAGLESLLKVFEGFEVKIRYFSRTFSHHFLPPHPPRRRQRLEEETQENA